MDQETSTKLEGELEKHLKTLSTFAEQAVEQRNGILSASVQGLVTTHSDQIRNLGLVSGVVAPFSLTLLQIQSIDVLAPVLLFGFLLLLFNIIFSQFLLGRELNHKNKLATKALLEQTFASSNKSILTDTNQPSQNRANASFELLKNIQEVDKFLGLSSYSTEPIEATIRLQAYTRWTVLLFATGCALIVFSVIFAPLIDSVKSALELISLLL